MRASAPNKQDSRSLDRTGFLMNRSFRRGDFRTRMWSCLAICLASIPIASTAFAAENIRVSYATLSAAYMDHICAMDKGYFREEGLNIEVIRAPGGVATPGL